MKHWIFTLLFLTLSPCLASDDKGLTCEEEMKAFEHHFFFYKDLSHYSGSSSAIEKKASEGCIRAQAYLDCIHNSPIKKVLPVLNKGYLDPLLVYLSADHNFNCIINETYEGEPEELKQSIDRLKTIADKGFLRAKELLALTYLIPVVNKQLNQKPDYKKAADLLETLYPVVNNGQCVFLLAHIYASSWPHTDGTLHTPEPQKVKELFRSHTLTTQDEVSSVKDGLIDPKRKFTPPFLVRRPKLAFMFLETCCEKKLTFAYAMLGDMYESDWECPDGETIPTDLSKAIETYKQGALRGNAQCIHALSNVLNHRLMEEQMRGDIVSFFIRNAEQYPVVKGKLRYQIYEPKKCPNIEPEPLSLGTGDQTCQLLADLSRLSGLTGSSGLKDTRKNTYIHTLLETVMDDLTFLLSHLNKLNSLGFMLTNLPDDKALKLLRSPDSYCIRFILFNGVYYHCIGKDNIDMANRLLKAVDNLTDNVNLTHIQTYCAEEAHDFQIDGLDDMQARIDKAIKAITNHIVDNTAYRNGAWCSFLSDED